MPQLDFSWWLVNFILIWAAVLVVFVIISKSATPQENLTPSNTGEVVKKVTAEWQWS